MVSKATTKFIKSLQLKKYRNQEQCFLVEGEKSVLEVLQSEFKIRLVVGSESFVSAHDLSKYEVIVTTDQILSGLSTFKNNSMALAIVEFKKKKIFQQNNETVLVLDNIRDPGNLGTIVRIADWYGIDKILCSEETTDLYNPKVIASSMGSFIRTTVYYENIVDCINRNSKSMVYGAFLKGDNVHKLKFESPAFIVIGNESRGISREVENKVNQRIMIPRFGGAESLNAAVATAIICDNLRR